ncbi:MAG: hypothetical protein Salg2KO_12730 [Salibacteraceae bacterium]
MNKAIRPIYAARTLFFTLLLSTIFFIGQAQLVSYDFGNAATCGDIDTVNTSIPNNVWRIVLDNVNSVDTTNRWFISARETGEGVGNCSDGCQNNSGSNNTLHISTNTTSIDPGAVYENDSIADIYAYAPEFDAQASPGDLLVEFDYLHGGSGNTDNAWFVVTIGNSIAQLTNPVFTWNLPKTTTASCPGGEWEHYQVYLDASVNTQTQLNLGFHWVNNGDGIGSNPSIAIDNFEITETAPLPIIGASTDTICNGDVVFFSDSSLGNVDTYEWKFGSAQSPSTSTAADPGNVIFPNPGTYTVTLTTTNGNGSDSTFKDIVVQTCVPPVIDMTPTDVELCQGQCIDFFDASTPGTFGKGEWAWQFQGAFPPTSSLQNPTGICYPATGVYNVTLTVTDTVSDLSATKIFTDTINVGTCQVPTAAFIADTNYICNNDFVEFKSLATGDPDIIQWEFGANANPSILQGPADDLDTVQVFFPTPGFYTVTMTVSNGAGTDDTVGIFQVIQVDSCPPPIPIFTVSNREICPTDIVVFEDLSTKATEWEWEFPGGLPSASTDRNPEVRYDSAGVYPVILTVKNVNGDSTLIEEEYIVVDSCLPPDPRFEVERDRICRGSCVQFFNTSLRADSIFWIFWWHPYEDSVGSDTITVFYMVSEPGENDTIDTVNYVVQEDYYPMFIKPDSTVDTLFMEQDPIFCFNDSGVVGVQLFAFNEYGVAIENSQDVTVLNIGGAYPKLKVGPDKTLRIDNIESRFYLEDTTRFEIEGTAPYYNWVPEIGQSCYDCEDPIVYPEETRKYYVTNYDDYGCQAYDSISVFVEESYYAGIPNIFSPNGDGVNDILWVRGNGISSEGFTMKVWNRYGEQVFQSFTQNEGWDGTFKGDPAPLGAYNYYVKLVFLDGTTKELKGNVTIVRY